MKPIELVVNNIIYIPTHFLVLQTHFTGPCYRPDPRREGSFLPTSGFVVRQIKFQPDLSKITVFPFVHIMRLIWRIRFPEILVLKTHNSSFITAQ